MSAMIVDFVTRPATRIVGVDVRRVIQPISSADLMRDISSARPVHGLIAAIYTGLKGRRSPHLSYPVMHSGVADVLGPGVGKALAPETSAGLGFTRPEVDRSNGRSGATVAQAGPHHDAASIWLSAALFLFYNDESIEALPGKIDESRASSGAFAARCSASTSQMTGALDGHSSAFASAQPSWLGDAGRRDLVSGSFDNSQTTEYLSGQVDRLAHGSILRNRVLLAGRGWNRGPHSLYLRENVERR